MLNKTRITVLAWLRAVKLSPSSGGGWMARTVWNGVLISGAGIWAEHWRQCPLPGAIKTLEWSSVLMSPEWLYLSLPHFLSHPEGEKLEAQVLKGCKVWSWPEVRPLWPGASCSLNSQGFPPSCQGWQCEAPRTDSKATLSTVFIQQTQMDFYLGKFEMPICRLRLKVSKILKATTASTDVSDNNTHSGYCLFPMELVKTCTLSGIYLLDGGQERNVL